VTYANRLHDEHNISTLHSEHCGECDLELDIGRTCVYLIPLGLRDWVDYALVTVNSFILFVASQTVVIVDLYPILKLMTSPPGLQLAPWLFMDLV
jgi:hypothetical protein